MSFILDALKKLEHKRKRGSVPDLMTVHDPLPQEHRRSPVWSYLVVSALILNAGILSVWIFLAQSDRKDIHVQETSGQLNGSSLSHPAGTPPPARGESRVQENNTPAPSSASEDGLKTASPDAIHGEEKTRESENAEKDIQEKVPDTTESPEDIAGSRVIFPAAREKTGTISQNVKTSFPSPDIPDAPEKEALYNHELPEYIQQELPKISISSHIYSNDPASRLVSINSQIIREGQSVADGLKLEEITPTGIILNFKGHRFHMKGF